LKCWKKAWLPRLHPGGIRYLDWLVGEAEFSPAERVYHQRTQKLLGFLLDRRLEMQARLGT
jgi:hypothetical protein